MNLRLARGKNQLKIVVGSELRALGISTLRIPFRSQSDQILHVRLLPREASLTLWFIAGAFLERNSFLLWSNLFKDFFRSQRYSISLPRYRITLFRRKNMNIGEVWSGIVRGTIDFHLVLTPRNMSHAPFKRRRQIKAESLINCSHTYPISSLFYYILSLLIRLFLLR